MLRLTACSLLLVSSLHAAGCAHSVLIDSDPSGAVIKMNGEKIGEAPVTYNETTGWEKIYDIEASKPGFRPTRRQVKQSEWNAPVTVASGLCFLGGCLPALAGLFWSRQMPERIVVSMEPEVSPVAGPSAPPPSFGY